MEVEKIVLYGVIGLVVSLVMTYMNNGANKTVVLTNGEVELKMNKLYQIIGYIGIAFSLIFTIGALTSDEKGLLIMISLIWILMGGSGILCLLYYRNHRVKFDDKKLDVKNWLGKSNEVRWDEIQEIKFNTLSGYLKINDRNTEMKIHQHIVGLKEFTRMMEKKTIWRIKDLKLPFK